MEKWFYKIILECEIVQQLVTIIISHATVMMIPGTFEIPNVIHAIKRSNQISILYKIYTVYKSLQQMRHILHKFVLIHMCLL